jgi:hypothetical protein
MEYFKTKGSSFDHVLPFTNCDFDHIFIYQIMMTQKQGRYGCFSSEERGGGRETTKRR